MKKSEPKISIIMAEYNTPIELLKNSIASILNQTFKDFEFIIVDDCGCNNLEKIVKEFNDKRIKILKNQNNMGLVFSLNKAILYAKGEYIARMDTDDYAYPKRLELEYNFIKENKEYSVVGMRCNYYDGVDIYGSSQKVGKVMKEELLNFVPYIHPTVIMKKEDIIKVGMYDDFKRCEDYALWIKLYLNGYNGYVMDEIGLRYTIRKEDYKKRGLKTRKGLFQLIKTEYQKLNPGKFQTLKIKLKNIIAGIMPGSLMYKYHKKVNKNDETKKDIYNNTSL